MKIGVFSDSHYCSAELLCGSRRCSLSLKKIGEALDFFDRESVDICVCLGDIIDHHQDEDGSRALLSEVADELKERKYPFLYVPGNHDYVCLEPEEITGMLGVTVPPYTVDACGFRFIVLDGNYDSNMVRYGSFPFDWKDSNLPQSQLEYLENELASSERKGEKTYVISLHASGYAYKRCKEQKKREISLRFIWAITSAVIAFAVGWILKLIF